MALSTGKDDRRGTGQILNRLLQHFRADLMATHDPLEFPGVRYPHLHVFGNLGRRGARLTDLAARASLGLAACSELVNDLERLGYVERCSDPTDRRAKLIVPTARGAQLLAASAGVFATIDETWRSLIGADQFDAIMAALDDLLTTLDQR